MSINEGNEVRRKEANSGMKSCLTTEGKGLNSGQAVKGFVVRIHDAQTPLDPWIDQDLEMALYVVTWK